MSRQCRRRCLWWVSFLFVANAYSFVTPSRSRPQLSAASSIHSSLVIKSPSLRTNCPRYDDQKSYLRLAKENPEASSESRSLPVRLWERLAETRNPWWQFLLVLAGYTFHLLVLTQHQWVFSWQWMSLNKSNWIASYRHFVGLGYDSLAGLAVFVAFLAANQWRLTPQKLPWNLPSMLAEPLTNNSTTDVSDDTEAAAGSSPNWPAVVHRGTFLITTASLVYAYFATGRLSLFWQDTLYQMSAKGWQLTAPLFRAWTVLLGHLSWVFTGSVLLAAIPAAPRFFGSSKQPKRWFRFRFKREKWWLWVLGGYLVSSWVFNLADWANHYILPAQVLQEGTESSVVSQLVAPEHNDRAASLLGYIAPCLTAPIWEEILYRGFLLAGLSHWTGRFHLSAVLQAVVFSAHHMSLAAALPLFVLGYAWAVMYGLSRNLWTVCFIHALWNSRVFLGSWLGL